jgi:hypothetical protein
VAILLGMLGSCRFVFSVRLDIKVGEEQGYEKAIRHKGIVEALWEGAVDETVHCRVDHDYEELQLEIQRGFCFIFWNQQRKMTSYELHLCQVLFPPQELFDPIAECRQAVVSVHERVHERIE